MSSQDRGSETREDDCFYAVVEAPFEHLQQPETNETRGKSKNYTST